MAIQGAFVGFSLLCRSAVPLAWSAAASGAAFSLAVAIWTMHFVGMLAARLPFPR
jgi:NO-binding membrane sensor protein with MHYT domain